MNSQHWAKQQERGSLFFLKLTGLIVKYSPLWFIRFATFCVVCYFFCTAKKARQHIRYYHQCLMQSKQVVLPPFAIFRQFLHFGESIIDRFAVWQHKIRYQDLIIDDTDNIYGEMIKQERGQLLICSHLGNIEICRALLNNGHHKNFRLNVLVHSKNAELFNQALGADKLSLIQVEDLDLAQMLQLSERIERGEWLAIAADRIPLQSNKTESVMFLGQPAKFPQGAWLLASLLKMPINTVFCLKENGKYRLKLRRFSTGIAGKGADRHQQIKQAIQQYAQLLAKECAKNPLLWFNFYDFWS